MADERTNEVSIVDLIPALRAFARTLCRIPDDADELVQETLTKGLASIATFKPGTRMGESSLQTLIERRNLLADGQLDSERHG